MSSSRSPEALLRFLSAAGTVSPALAMASPRWGSGAAVALGVMWKGATTEPQRALKHIAAVRAVPESAAGRFLTAVDASSRLAKTGAGLAFPLLVSALGWWALWVSLILGGAMMRCSLPRKGER